MDADLIFNEPITVGVLMATPVQPPAPQIDPNARHIADTAFHRPDGTTVMVATYETDDDLDSIKGLTF